VNLFKNKTALHTFITLLVVSLLIQVAGIFAFTMYYGRARYQVSRWEMADNFSRAVQLAHIIPAKRLQRQLQVLNGRGINATIADNPPKEIPLVPLQTPKQLRAYANKHYPHLQASFALPNGRWLTLQGYVYKHPWLLSGFVSSAVVLFILLIGLCLWAVRRLALPVDELTKAARRFGVDVQAPPLPVSGSPEMRDVVKAFNEMQGRIRRLITDRTQMLAAISHDLRTPITRLQLRAEYLKDTPQYDKAIADLNEMEKMISSILAFAREYIRDEAMETFDLNALLDAMCDDLSDAGMAVTYQGAQTRLPVFGRMTSLKRALSNLTENAVKYGKEARVSVHQKGQEMVVTIIDKGPGIPESEMEKVFEPFYRVDAARSPSQSGTGLGMAVARDVILAHGGDIQLRNREQGGLKVVVTLPCKPLS